MQFNDIELTKVLSQRLMVGASLGVLALMNTAAAQDQGAIPETVTVTGTLIKGINPVGTSAITIDAAAIQATGALNTNQILEQVPEITSAFNQNVAPFNATIGASGGTASPTIRNITAAGATLVLVDGHTVVDSAVLSVSNDPSLLPSGILQRVDVVADGGSSLYGADATTGIINFITRTSFEGVQTNFALGTANGYTSYSASLMAGHDWGSGSAYIAYETKGNTYLMDRDRSYTRQNLTDIGGRDSRATACPLPNITVGASNYAQTSLAANTPGSLKADVTGPFAGLVNPTNDNPAGGGQFNRCNTNSNVSLFPREEQNSVFASLKQHIMEGVDLVVKANWSGRLDSTMNTQLSATGTIDNTNPYFQSINGETQQTVQFDFSPYLNQNAYPTTEYADTFWVAPELTVALPFGDWEAKVLGNYGRSWTNILTRNVNTSALTNALRQTTTNGVKSPALVADPTVGNALDPYNVGLTNPTLLNALLNYGNLGQSTQHQEQGEIRADGTVISLPGGDVKAVFGYKYNFNDYHAVWGINYPIGQISGAPVAGGEFQPAKAHQFANSFYGELAVPVISDKNSLPMVHSLTLDISGRYDGYNAFAAAKTFKMGFTYEPIEDLNIRGNMGSSYDVPNLGSVAAPDGRYNYTPQRTSPNLVVPPGTTAAQALAPSILVPGGNPNLVPEVAHTWSVGADFHPSEYAGIDFTGLDLGITSWHIFLEHQIGLPPFSSVQLFQVPSYAQYYIINPTPAQVASYGDTALINFPGTTIASAYPVSLGGTAPNGSITAPYILYDARRNNLGNAALDGLDWTVNYRRDVGFGTLSFGFNGTYTLSNNTQAFSGAPLTNIQASGVPLYSFQASLGLISGPFSARVAMQYSAGFLQNPASTAVTIYGQTRIPAFHPVNASFSYDLDGISSWTNGAQLSLTVNNIGNDHPPIVLSGGTANGSTLGRYLLVDLRKTF